MPLPGVTWELEIHTQVLMLAQLYPLDHLPAQELIILSDKSKQIEVTGESSGKMTLYRMGRFYLVLKTSA